MIKQFSVIPVENYYVVVQYKHMTKHCYYFYTSICLGNPMGVVGVIVATIGKRIDTLPLIEIADETEELAKHHIFPQFDFKWYKEEDVEVQKALNDFKEGYKAGQSKGTYTEEDMKKCFKSGHLNGWNIRNVTVGGDWNYGLDGFEELFKDYIDSLQKKKVIKAVVLEMVCFDEVPYPSDEFNQMWENKQDYKIKITNTETNIITPKEFIYVK